MLENGFYLPPAQFETAFVSTAHMEKEIDAFIKSALKVMKKLK
jgi:glutamate-1-semialdehyde 2,1-aminomutase